MRGSVGRASSPHTAEATFTTPGRSLILRRRVRRIMRESASLDLRPLKGAASRVAARAQSHLDVIEDSRRGPAAGQAIGEHIFAQIGGSLSKQWLGQRRPGTKFVRESLKSSAAQQRRQEARAKKQAANALADEMRSAIQTHGGPLEPRTRSSLLRQVTASKQAAKAETTFWRIVSLETKIEGFPDVVEPTAPRAAGGEGADYEAMVRLERGLRRLIEERLEPLDSDWWGSRVPKAARNRAESRLVRNDAQYPWMRGKSVGVVHYLDFPDYATIICEDRNWGEAFEAVFGDRDLVGAKLRELGPIRRDIAHSRPLTEKQRKKLELYSEEILEMVDQGA